MGWPPYWSHLVAQRMLQWIMYYLPSYPLFLSFLSPSFCADLSYQHTHMDTWMTFGPSTAIHGPTSPVLLHVAPIYSNVTAAPYSGLSPSPSLSPHASCFPPTLPMPPHLLPIPSFYLSISPFSSDTHAGGRSGALAWYDDARHQLMLFGGSGVNIVSKYVQRWTIRRMKRRWERRERSREKMREDERRWEEGEKR